MMISILGCVDRGKDLLDVVRCGIEGRMARIRSVTAVRAAAGESVMLVGE